MCRAVKCGTCGKMTWAGCGQHIEAVRCMTRARCCCCGLRTHWPLRARKHARGTSRAASRPSHVARRVFYVVLTQPVRFRRWRRTRPLSAARVDPTALPRQVAPAPCNETCGNCAAWPRAAPRGHALGLLPPRVPRRGRSRVLRQSDEAAQLQRQATKGRACGPQRPRRAANQTATAL